MYFRRYRSRLCLYNFPSRWHPSTATSSGNRNSEALYADVKIYVWRNGDRLCPAWCRDPRTIGVWARRLQAKFCHACILHTQQINNVGFFNRTKTIPTSCFCLIHLQPVSLSFSFSFFQYFVPHFHFAILFL